MVSGFLAVVRASRIGRRGVMGVLAGAVLLGAASAGRAAALQYYSASGSSVTLVAPAALPANDGSGHNYDNSEGVIYDASGYVLFAQMNHNYVNDIEYKYTLGGGAGGAGGTLASLVTNVGGSQGTFLANGGGTLVTADRDARQISFRSATSFTTINSTVNTYTDINGNSGGTKQFYGPNDLVMDAAGGVFFTDPSFTGFSNNPGKEAVYYIASGALSAQQVITYDTTVNPNGIILNRGTNMLYVGRWASNKIYKYDVSDPIHPGTESLFTAAAHPDGMTIDPWGNIIVGCTNGIYSYSPTGEQNFYFSTGTNTSVTNVDIGEVNGVTTLFYNMGGSGMGLYSVALTFVPEPASLGVLGAGLAVLALRRRRR